jgi:hypothetical protein
MKIRIIKQNKQVIDEAMKTPADLPKNYRVVIFDGKSFVEVYYKLLFKDSNVPEITGQVIAEKISNQYCIDNAFEITKSEATKKWGPLLYDVMLEYVTNRKKGYIVPDRGMVSGDAKKVWNYYLENREDVKKTPLDIHVDTMRAVYGSETSWPDEFKDKEGNLKKRTEEDGDDCIQDTSIYWAVGKGDWTKHPATKAKKAAVANPKQAAKWPEQSVSYAYKKPDQKTINALTSEQQLERERDV